MHTVLIIMVALLMLATLGVLLAGVITMGSSPDGRRANKLMQWRVLLQGTAIVLFLIMMSLLRS